MFKKDGLCFGQYLAKTKYLMKTISHYTNLKTLSLSIVALVLFTFAFTSCTKDKSNDSLSVSLMVVNAAQGSAPQDFYVDNSKADISAVAYGSNSTTFAGKSGSHQAEFKNTGTSTVTATANLSLTANQFYTVFYTGGSSSSTYQNDRTQPQTGKARVRFIHLSSATSGNVDFSWGGTKIASNVGYKIATSYYDVSPTGALDVFAAGTTTSKLSLTETLEAGHIYTIYLSDAASLTIASVVKES